jgi:hypothetical protein
MAFHIELAALLVAESRRRGTLHVLTPGWHTDQDVICHDDECFVCAGILVLSHRAPMRIFCGSALLGVSSAAMIIKAIEKGNYEIDSHFKKDRFL